MSGVTAVPTGNCDTNHYDFVILLHKDYPENRKRVRKKYTVHKTFWADNLEEAWEDMEHWLRTEHSNSYGAHVLAVFCRPGKGKVYQSKYNRRNAPAR